MSLSPAPPPLPPPSPAQDSRWATVLSILSKFSGVKDIATVRFSLPAHLLEPIPNLEYWGYLDRPDYFAAIPDPPLPLLRMLACLRWAFTKDIKFFGKVCKPYNSVLGEFFRCHWDVLPLQLPFPHAKDSSLSSGSSTSSSKSDVPVRISYITEQTSHHPPVSAFVIDCPQKNIRACGMDQISARFTGTAVKVTPGQHNLGIFISCRDNETYNYTHPLANVTGFLRGNPYITVEGCATISCPSTKLKTIISYPDEKWIGKPKFLIQGLVFEYDPENDNITKLKNVPQDKILARISGSWRSQITYAINGSSESHLLIDLTNLSPVPKTVPPLNKQLPHESQLVWHAVTEAIQKGEFSLATKLKTLVEEEQRQKAAERKLNNEHWVPRYFQIPVVNGKPRLTEKGESILRDLQLD